jgi:rare lipoprotein A
MQNTHAYYSKNDFQISASFTLFIAAVRKVRQGKVVMKRVKRIYAAVLLAAATFIGCQQALAECGIASTYSSGSRTANGEHYNHMGVSAAHKTLPFGTRVVVRNQRTGRSITVRINDRGPFIAGRIIDLSTGAKNALGMDGLASVCLEIVSYGGGNKGFRNPDLREPLQVANGAHQMRNPSAATPRYAHRGGKRYARVHYRVRKGHRGSRRRIYASNDD